MKIKSNVAEATKYSNDALEAFYTAVENGQARLALLILVDVIEEFANRFDELEEKAPNQEVAKQEAKEVVAPVKEQVKETETSIVEEKPAPKAKAAVKDNAAE